MEKQAKPIRENITVGKIRGLHGVKGYLKVESFSDYALRFSPGSVFLTENKSQTALDKPNPAVPEKLVVEASSAGGKRLLVKFAGIDDRNSAEILKGLLLLIPESEVAPLPQGRYYHWQLEGLDIWEKGVNLGKLKNVQENAANDLFIVEKNGGGSFMIPASKEIVKKIDLERRIMEVELPQGLYDE